MTFNPQTHFFRLELYTKYVDNKINAQWFHTFCNTVLMLTTVY